MTPEPLRPAIETAGLVELVEQFLLSRRVRNCTARTLGIYDANLRRFTDAVGGDLGGCAPLRVQGYLTALRAHMKPISVHQHYRTLRTFFAWAVAVGAVARHPLAGVEMKAPRTLPRVPEDQDVRRLFGACPPTTEGARNRALIALLADAGLRVSEALHLRWEDVDWSTRTLRIHAGKGGKDGTGFFGDTAAVAARAWFAAHPRPEPQAFVFVTAMAQPLTRYRACQILHRLSRRAGLARKIGPHALRHYAATSLLRRTGDLELVRRVLRHESLAMTLRYAALTQTEVAAKFLRSSPLDHLGAPAPERRGRDGKSVAFRTTREQRERRLGDALAASARHGSAPGRIPRERHDA